MVVCNRPGPEKGENASSRESSVMGLSSRGSWSEHLEFFFQFAEIPAAGNYFLIVKRGAEAAALRAVLHSREVV